MQVRALGCIFKIKELGYDDSKYALGFNLCPFLQVKLIGQRSFIQVRWSFETIAANPAAWFS